MYEAENKSNIVYLVIFGAALSLIIWAIFMRFRPLILEASCSEIASSSSNIVKGAHTLYPDSSFENVKSRCLEDSLKGKKEN